MPKKPFFTFAFFGWLVFITYSSLTSISSGKGFFDFDIPHGDKLVHFAFYFVASLLGVFFLREQAKRTLKRSKALVFMFFLTMVFGIVIEVLQHSLTTSREGDIFDALANGLGSLSGILISNFLFSSKRFVNWE